MVDGQNVHDSVRAAVASWNAIAHSAIELTVAGIDGETTPSIGNGRNEFGWVEASNSPYFIPGVPCTIATIYDTASGLVNEADSICNAMSFQWPPNLFGLYTQDGVSDAQSAALSALGSWLGLDGSLDYGDPMYPEAGPGSVIRQLLADEFAFARHQYGDGTSPNGSITGTVRWSSGANIPFAYVSALSTGVNNVYGTVADANGAFVIEEPVADSYYLVTRPLTTDPYVLSSVPYRANPISNLAFSPEYYNGGVPVLVTNGSTTSGVDIVVHRSGTQPDPFEANDTQSTASPLPLGYSRLGTTHALHDKDWYWFQTLPNTCYLVSTSLHGASIVSTSTRDTFWSRTRLTLYDGIMPAGENSSKDARALDPGSWITYCELGSSRRLDLAVEQRTVTGGPGFFYSIFAKPILDGSTLTPAISGLYPNSGWANRNRFVWLEGDSFMPGSTVDIRLAGGTWTPASQVFATRCNASGRCGALKAFFPAATAGLADVRVTNPNARSAIKTNAFTYLATAGGPLVDRTPEVFGARYGQGKAVCVGDYDKDGSDDILKVRYASLPYQLFRNQGGESFVDVAATSGLRLDPPLYGQSCSFIDVDDDGDLDVYTTNLAAWLPDGSSNELYFNQLAESGTPTFVRNTPAGLGGQATRFQRDAAWADFDDDGRVDVVLAYDSYAESPPYHDAVRYFRQGPSGTFIDATGSSGLIGYVAAISSVKAADFDDDGCEDLVFFTNGGNANRLYRGNCHGHFDNVTGPSHVADGSPWCTGIGLADFNNDSRIDILCGTYNAGSYPMRPRLWLNNGNSTFTDRASEAGLYAVARNMDVVLPLDEDNDGLTDVFIGASENGWADDRKDVLLRNNGGNPPVFLDITDAASLYPTTQDGSGWCTAEVGEFYCDRDAFAGGVLDWRNDGTSDVFITGDDPDALQRGSDFFWDNRRYVIMDGSIAPSNDWIEVELDGANTRQSRVLSNRQGIGARVTVIPRFNLPGGLVPTETQCLQYPLPAGIGKNAQEVLAGNQSQSTTVLHFGLGNTLPFGQKRIDCVKVVWPSGLERAYVGLVANTKVVLSEDVGRMKVIGVVPNNGLNIQSAPTTIVGLRFDRDIAAVPQVFFGAAPAASVTFVSEHELTVLPPLGQPPGSVNVTVVNTDGARDTLLAGYTFTGSNTVLRFKDPVPDLVTSAGVVPNDPSFIAARGIERTGVVADGVTQLVFELDVGGTGSVRFELDDDDNPANTPPGGPGVGTMTGLGGGTPSTSVTVPVTFIATGARIAQSIYRAPQDFLRSVADEALGSRSIRVRTTFIDAGHVEHPMPVRVLELYRVPVLYVHGMWGDTHTFEWAVLDDTRWIARRADYSETNSVAFAENVGTPPRLVAELRKEINDRGIAGTRFFVFAHSMGALLFKIYLSGAGAPYARADNYFAGDVYALVSVDASYFGSYLASFARYVAALRVVGPYFSERMRAAGFPIDAGCMSSLEPDSPDVLGIPPALGMFHAITGWGGGEMRRANAELVGSRPLVLFRLLLEMFNLSFDNYLLKCETGDDLVVCTESQQGGLTGGYLDAFHYVDGSSRAIHFDSIAREYAPSLAAERLLNTPTTNISTWALVLPSAPPPPSGAEAPADAAAKTVEKVALAEDGIRLSVDKAGDGVALSWAGTATRVLKSHTRNMQSGLCLDASGTGYLDPHELAVPESSSYTVGASSLCSPANSLSIASITPAAGSTMGGYTLTILGAGFDATSKVRIGELYASGVVVVNSTTITCRAMPGAAGPATVVVFDGAGHSAASTFTYTDAGAIPGGVVITAPSEGTTVLAGSTITVSASGVGGFSIARALASSRAFASDTDLDGTPAFTTNVVLPPDVVGPVTIDLLAKDVNGNVKSAMPVAVNVVVSGSVTLVRIEADPLVFLYATPTRRLRVYGIYSDGIRREITNTPGIAFEMETQDIRKPNYPYNGTGVAAVDGIGTVTAKTTGSTRCRVTYGGQTIDVVVEVAEVRPTLSLQRPGFISWPYQGPGVTYDVIRGKLSALRSSGGDYGNPMIAMTCIKNDFVNVTAADTTNPAVGDGFFYLMRDSRWRSYDDTPFWSTRSQSGERSVEIVQAPNSCP